MCPPSHSALQAPPPEDPSGGALAELRARYLPLSPEERMAQLFRDFRPDEVMLTSSFAATSALLLDVYARAAPQRRVYFIDTGFHFPQTLAYKQQLTELLNLDVVDVRAEEWKHAFTVKDQTWQHDPDFCCSINKVEPLEEIKKGFRVWISGLMRWQTDHRAQLEIFDDRGGILKFYPLLDVTREQRDAMIGDRKLPFHPLVAQGYWSIGCAQCTAPGVDRSGRWNNRPKTECGLHL
jgi:phosphoadenosine phosphosulfate reductase